MYVYSGYGFEIIHRKNGCYLRALTNEDIPYYIRENRFTGGPTMDTFAFAKAFASREEAMAYAEKWMKPLITEEDWDDHD